MKEVSLPNIGLVKRCPIFKALMKQGTKAEKKYKPLLVLLCYMIYGCSTYAQIQVSIVPPVPMTMSPCQTTPFYLSVKNHNTGADTFAISIALSADQSVDSSSLLTLPAGFKDTITTTSAGYQVLTIYTTSPMAAGSSVTLTYSIVGLGCVSNVSAQHLSQTINVTNVSGASYSGAGGYVIANSTPGYPYLLSYINATPNLTPVTSTTFGIIDTIAPGQSASFRAIYVNSGPVSYNGSISIGGAFPCLDSNNVTVNSINIYVHDTITPVATLTGPITSFPVQFCNLHIDSNSLLIVEENITLSANSCIGSSGCTALLDLSWGCSTACTSGSTPVYCHNNDSTPIPLSIAPKPVPFDVRFIRILPVPPANESFPWESVCHGLDTTQSENEWKFLVQNDGVSTAENVTLRLFDDAPRISNTFIRRKSIHINQPDSTLSITSPIAGVTDSIINYQVSDFSNSNPLACFKNIKDTLYPGDIPIKSLKCVIPHLAAGKKMVIEFKTYRCCAWDNTPNTGVFYNHWQLEVSAQTPCEALGVTGPPVYMTEVGFGTARLVDTPHNVYGYTAWTTYHDAGYGISLDYGAEDRSDPDLSLTQNFNPQNTDLSAPTGGCGDTNSYNIQNVLWNTTNNNSDDFDAMVFCATDTFGGTGIGGIPGEVGINPQSQFIVDFNFAGANLHVPGNSVNMVGIINGVTYTWPSSSVTTTATGARAVFNISVLNTIVPIHTSLDLRYFMVSSYIDFGLYMCCPVGVPNPVFTITTSFNARPGTCPSCIIPLSAVSSQLYLHCPGCVTPGLIADEFSFKRKNLGFEDANNDRRPDSTTVITPAYQFYNLVNVNSSVIGDTLLAVSSGYLKDGDGTRTGGFTLSQWRTAIGNDSLFTDFYLEQTIGGASTVGLSCLSAVVEFFHNGVLTNSTPVTPVLIGNTFIYHINDAHFNTRLIERDRFTVIAQYRACTNPAITTQLPVSNIMYVTKGAESLASDPFQIAIDPHSFLLANDPGALGLPAAQYVLAHQAPPCLFWCEGFGGNHRVYPLTSTYSEYWNDYDACTKTLSINVLNQIGNPLVDGTNLFPFEYRTVPSVLRGNIINGPTLSNGDPIHFSTNALLPGYSFTPTSVSTTVPYVPDLLHILSVTSTVSQANPPNQTIINSSGSTTDWIVNLSKVQFITPDTGIHAITSLPNTNLTPSISLVNTVNHDPELLVGDELFSETMNFNVTATCARIEPIDTIPSQEISVLVPGRFDFCGSTDYRVWDSTYIYNTTPSQHGSYLTAPNPDIVPLLNPIWSNYPHTSYSTIDNLIVLSANFYTPVPNLYFYIEVDTNGVSTLPPGISVGTFCVQSPSSTFDTIVPQHFTVGTNTYWSYPVPNGSVYSLQGNGTGLNFYLSLLDSECYNIPPQVVLPVHYVWNCDTFASGLPPVNSCAKDTFVTINYQVPVVNLYSEISAPSTFSTCAPITVVATLLNQQLGGAGHFVAHVTLPNNFSIVKTNNTLQIIPPIGPTQTATLSGVSITHVADIDTSKQDWTIRIDSLTNFSDSSMLGTSGLNNATGLMRLTFNIVTGCTTPPAPLNFTLTMNGWRFCDLTHFNPSVPGDLNDTFPSVTIQPASGTAFNGCGPYLNLTGTDVTCHGNANGEIVTVVSVSFNDTTYFPKPAFTYSWSSGVAGTGLPPSPYSPLAPGIYTITVTDTVNHCTATAFDTITQPAVLTDSITITNATLYGCSNATATVYPIGGNGGNLYRWSTTPVQTTQTATGLAAGNTYSVTVKDSKGCTKVSHITLPAVHPPVITGSSYICSGSATILDAGSGDSTYSWSTGGATETVSVSSAGTYYVTVTKNSCSATASFNLTTSPLPDPVTTISGYEMCSVDNNASGSLDAPYSGNGGTNTNRLKGLSVTSAPFTLDQSKPCTQVCAGSTSQISVTPSNPGDSVKVTIVGGTKTLNTTLTTSLVTVYDVTWGSPGQGSITVEESYLGGCSRLETFCIDILTTPTAKFGILGVSTSGTVIVCANNAVSFIDSSYITVAGINAIYSNIVGWNWNFGDGTSSNIENPSHTYTTPGVYTVILSVTSSCNCVSSDTLRIKVEAGSAMSIECPSVVCSGDTATYTVTGCTNVIWASIGGTITHHTPTTVTIVWNHVGSSGFGYVTATPSGCQTCTAPVTAKIPVIIPNVPIQGPANICVGNNTYFDAPLWPGAIYTWSVINGSPNPNAAIIAYNNEYRVLIRAADSGTFKLKLSYTDPVAGCGDSTFMTVHVSGKVRATANPQSGCVNNPVTFSLSNSAVSRWVVVGPDGTADTLASGAAVNSTTFTPHLAGSYTVDVTSPNVCIDAPLTYVVDTTAHVGDSLITGPQTVCRNIPFTYFATRPAPAGAQYKWSLASATSGTIIGTNVGNSVVVKWNPSIDSGYLIISVSPTVPTTCIDTTTKRYKVDMISPDPAFNIPLTVCPNSVSSAVSAVSNSEDYYTWSFSPANLASCVVGYEHNPHPMIQFNNVDTPTVVTIQLSVTRCNTTVFKDSTVTIKGTPTVTINHTPTSCTGVGVTFTATPSVIVSGTTYTWTMSDGTVRSSGTSNTLTYTFTQSGHYWVHVTASLTGSCAYVITSANDSFSVIPAATINITSNIPTGFTICPPGSASIPITFTPDPASYISSAIWNDNGTIIPGSAGKDSILVSSAGNYGVQITDSNGCKASASLQIINCPVQPPTCPGVIFSNESIVASCNDIITAQASYSIPTGYHFAFDNWSLYEYDYLVGSYTRSSTNTFLQTGYDTLQVDHSGYYDLEYQVNLINIATGDTTWCSTELYVNVPLHMDYRSSVHCSGSGYEISLADHSDYYGSPPISYTWTVPGLGTYSGPNVTTGLATPGHIYPITYTIHQANGTICSLTFNDTVPTSFPNAAFNYIDTPLSPAHNRSNICEGFSVRLQPDSAYHSNWTYQWHSTYPTITPPPTGIIAYNPSIEYGIVATGVTLTLVVNDQYGCSATASRTVNVAKNNMIGEIGPHNSLVQGENAIYFCPTGGSFSFDYQITNVPAGVPNKWKWYNIANPSQILSTSATLTSSGPSGRYLCIVTDVNGCQAISNPAGVIQVLPAPDISISANRDYCVGDSIVLSTVSLPMVSYKWTLDTMHYSGAVWTIHHLAAGTYTARLTYTDTFANSGITPATPVICSDTVASFTFTVYAVPTVTALIDTTRITCDPSYSVGLTAVGTSGLTSYTWSTGAPTQNTQVTKGGDYRVWLTGPGGCTAYSDVLVPEDPAVLLQYVPYGCYNYECKVLYGSGIEMEGPPNTVFQSWAWEQNGNPIAGHTGTNSAVTPYTVYYAGDYSLTINDGIDPAQNKCVSTSQLMQVSVYPVPCFTSCKLSPKITVSSHCVAGSYYPFTLDIVNSIYNGATYSLTSPSGSFTMLAPTTLTLGSQAITGHFIPNSGVSTGAVVHLVITLIYPDGTCQDTIDFKLPPCRRYGIEEEETDHALVTDGIKMNLMPNPASDIVTVMYSTGISDEPVPAGESLTLSLLDVSGKEIEAQPLSTVSGSVSIAVSSLSPGLYYVTLRRDHIPIATDKLVVVSH